MFPGPVCFTTWLLKEIRFFHEFLTILHQVHGKCSLFMGIDIFLTEYGFSLADAFNLNGFRIVHNAFQGSFRYLHGSLVRAVATADAVKQTTPKTDGG
ncbi:hypothetical protein EVA_10428 [gut metagenome]|uniref:Uncharacterized protein n=1 Tax=gut metagenome TaxID=749906 RepID=J9GHT0_9ZZZZ